MVEVVIGGSGSGKSAYAESLLQNYIENKFYIATMQVWGEEGQRKVERHKKLRAGKNFITLEKTRDVSELITEIAKLTEEEKPVTEEEPAKKDNIMKNVINKVALLECMSNLVANEMFGDDEIIGADAVAEKILKEIKELSEVFQHFVIVTNNVMEDGIMYDEGTREYIKALGMVNQGISQMADSVVEVVVGIPVKIE